MKFERLDEIQPSDNMRNVVAKMNAIIQTFYDIEEGYVSDIDAGMFGEDATEPKLDAGTF